MSKFETIRFEETGKSLVCEVKKAGSIVPKRFCSTANRKARHLIKFGCDVFIHGNTIYAQPGASEAAIVIPANAVTMVKQGRFSKRKVKAGTVSFKNTHIQTCGGKSNVAYGIKPKHSGVVWPYLESDGDWQNQLGSMFHFGTRLTVTDK